MSLLLGGMGGSLLANASPSSLMQKVLRGEANIDIEKLEKDLELVDTNGDVLLGLCTKVMLFFDKAYTQEKRQAILTMLDEYRAMLKEQVTFTQDREAEWVDLRNQPSPDVKTWLTQLPEDYVWEFIYKGGKREYDASNVYFSVVSTANWEENLGSISRILIHFPLTLFTHYSESIQDVLVRWLGYLQPLHGYAGIGTCRHLERELDYRTAEYNVAMKYKGLEITHQLREAIKLKRDAIKGISWQTILNQVLLDKVGGVKALSGIQGLSVWQAKSVYLIQASDYPMLSDLPESYYQLAQVLKPLYYQGSWAAQERGPFEKELAPLNAQVYRQWRERFFIKE